MKKIFMTARQKDFSPEVQICLHGAQYYNHYEKPIQILYKE